MISIRLILPVLFLILLNNNIYSQEKPGTSKIPDSLSLQSKDTDGDGVNDNEDKCDLDPRPANNFGCPVIVIADHGLKQRIFFATGTSRLSPASVKRLNMLVEILNENPQFCVNLVGHTDSLGNYKANMKLSVARAAAAQSYLLSVGINKNRIVTEGFGPDKPLVVNKTEAWRATNRRVDLILKSAIND